MSQGVKGDSLFVNLTPKLLIIIYEHTRRRTITYCFLEISDMDGGEKMEPLHPK